MLEDAITSLPEFGSVKKSLLDLLGNELNEGRKAEQASRDRLQVQYLINRLIQTALSLDTSYENLRNLYENWERFHIFAGLPINELMKATPYDSQESRLRPELDAIEERLRYRETPHAQPPIGLYRSLLSLEASPEQAKTPEIAQPEAQNQAGGDWLRSGVAAYIVKQSTDALRKAKDRSNSLLKWRLNTSTNELEYERSSLLEYQKMLTEKIKRTEKRTSKRTSGN